MRVPLGRRDYDGRASGADRSIPPADKHTHARSRKRRLRLIRPCKKPVGAPRRDITLLVRRQCGAFGSERCRVAAGSVSRCVRHASYIRRTSMQLFEPLCCIVTTRCIKQLAAVPVFCVVSSVQ